MSLSAFDCWIFDMDGTLTVAVHDFEAIRATLGLPPGEPILEALARLPAERSAALHAELYAIEIELARDARPGHGAEALLSELRGRGAKLGILTRNGVEIALETLRACGLRRYFEPRFVLGRESGEPKPNPAGIHKLLSMWNAHPERAVMVGDYYYDLAAGRSAGATTVYVDPSGQFQWGEYADVKVQRLDMLLALLD